MLRILLGVCAALPMLAAFQVPMENVQPLYNFSHVVVFGDSLVDNGNGTFLLTHRQWPRDPAYFDGRFSNGLVWPEYLATMAHIPHVQDRAYGSATTNNSLAHGQSGFYSNVTVPDVLHQTKSWVDKSGGTLDPHALYLISVGSNDFFFGANNGMPPTQLAKSAVDSLRVATRRLTDAGARHLAFEGVGPSDASPAACLSRLIPGAGDTADASAEFSRAYNTALRGLVASLKDVNATYLDMHRTVKTVLDDPERYGFKNSKDACLVGAYKEELDFGLKRHLCDAPHKHVYFDIYHPTTDMHRVIARAAAAQLAAHYNQTM